MKGDSPVSLTSVPCKILEHIVYKHVMDHLEPNKTLTSFNHGFKKVFSCEIQILAASNDIMSSLTKVHKVDVIAMDFTKAFDTVPHMKLLHKIHQYGIQGLLHSWLTYFLYNRQMKVVVAFHKATFLKRTSSSAT